MNKITCFVREIFYTYFSLTGLLHIIKSLVNEKYA